MSNHRKNKKMLQGMEHLKQAAAQSETIQATDAGIVSSADASEHELVRKEIIIVIVSVTIIVVVLVGLMLLDKKSDKFADFSHYLSSYFIK